MGLGDVTEGGSAISFGSWPTGCLPCHQQDAHLHWLGAFLSAPMLHPELVSWQAKAPTSHLNVADTKARKRAASLTATQLTSFQLGHWIRLLATHLTDGTPPQDLQGALASMVIVADTVGYALQPSTREVTKQALWAHLKVCHYVFPGLDPQVCHSMLWADPFSPTLIDEVTLSQCLASVPSEIIMNVPRHPILLPAATKQTLADKGKFFQGGKGKSGHSFASDWPSKGHHRGHNH